MQHTKTCLILTLMFVLLAHPGTANAQGDIDQFASLMDSLVTRVVSFENAYNPSLVGNIARTSRLEAYSRCVPEIDTIAIRVSGRTDLNSLRLGQLTEASRSMDPVAPEFLPILEEMWVRSVALACETGGIEPEVVGDYIRRESATFVANRGDFTHPGFDQSTLTGEDHIRIYFCGFGLVVLVHMEGGPEQAIELYRESSDLRGFFGNQLIFRGTDLDVDGLPMLEAVIFDPEISPAMGELFYGMIAGKLIGPGGQFGNNLVLSNEWKTTISDWTYEFIQTPERLEARLNLPFYGVDFEDNYIGPEMLLGVLGPTARPNITSLLASDDLMLNVAGLEALRWFDVETYPDDGDALLSMAEPLMASEDFTLGVLALDAFEADARFTGEQYDDARRQRLLANTPLMCDLMRRALEHPGVEYLSSSAWLDIFVEGTLIDELSGCMPMVAQVIVSDWTRKQAGEEIYVPEGEIELLARFIPDNVEYFNTTSDAVRGFLEDELNGGDVNPFSVWAYVNYLEGAKMGGVTFSDEWMSTLVRMKSWADSSEVLIRGDELREALDALMW